MRVEQLEIYQFRNIQEAHLPLAPHLTLVVGNNAQGKTNALEALHLVLQGRSFRSGSEHDWFPFNGPEAFSVSATAMSLSGSAESLQHRVVGTPRSRIHRGREIPVVVFTPDDLNLSKGSPSDRRRFLDSTLSQLNPRYAKTLRQYQHALLQRNRALKDPRLASAVESFTPALITHGFYLWQERARILRPLIHHARQIHERITQGDSLGAELHYGGSSVPINSEAEYAEALERRAVDERLRMVSLVGPHRDDLELQIGNRLAATFASQGQHRAVALSLKLATYTLIKDEWGETPMILLDDVLSELDPPRRQELLSVISQNGQQTIVTDTEARSYEHLDPTIYQVQNGTFHQWD